MLCRFSTRENSSAANDLKGGLKIRHFEKKTFHNKTKEVASNPACNFHFVSEINWMGLKKMLKCLFLLMCHFQKFCVGGFLWKLMLQDCLKSNHIVHLCALCDEEMRKTVIHPTHQRRSSVSRCALRIDEMSSNHENFWRLMAKSPKHRKCSAITSFVCPMMMCSAFLCLLFFRLLPPSQCSKPPKEMKVAALTHTDANGFMLQGFKSMPSSDDIKVQEWSPFLIGTELMPMDSDVLPCWLMVWGTWGLPQMFIFLQDWTHFNLVTFQHDVICNLLNRLRRWQAELMKTFDGRDLNGVAAIGCCLGSGGGAIPVNLWFILWLGHFSNLIIKENICCDLKKALIKKIKISQTLLDGNRNGDTPWVILGQGGLAHRHQHHHHHLKVIGTQNSTMTVPCQQWPQLWSQRIFQVTVAVFQAHISKEGNKWKMQSCKSWESKGPDQVLCV